MNKQCFKCDAVLPLSMFYRHKAMADGHLNKCIECAKRDVRRHRRDKPERVREYDRQRSKLAHRVALNVKNTARQREEHLERTAAHSAVARALRSGRLTKTPCELCGDPKVEAHHPAYSLPLAVVWLCPAHHRQIHLAIEDGPSAT